MDTAKSLVVFAIQPFLLPFEGEDFGLLEVHFIVSFQSKLSYLMVVVVRRHMEQSAVLVVEDLIYFRQKMLEKLLGFILIEALNSLEKLFLSQLCHL